MSASYTASDFDALASDCEKGYGLNATSGPALRAAAAQARVLEKLKDQLGNDPDRHRRHLSAYDDGHCDAMETAFARLMTLMAEEGLQG